MKKQQDNGLRWKKGERMKTIEEFYSEISGSKELQEELKSTSGAMLAEFLKKHNCGASVKEFTEFLDAKNNGEIGDNDAEKVAGGLPLYGLHKKQ